jgi:hypothetical protein
MKLAIPVFAVLAIVLVMGAPMVHASDPPSPPEPTSLANGPGQAKYNNFIGDKSRESPEVSPYNSSYVSYVDDGGPVKRKVVRHQALQKSGGNCITPDAGKSCGSDSTCTKGAVGRGVRPEKSWFYDPWVGVEYMNTWLGERSLPPLVTQSPPGTEGVLPGADTLFGGGVVGGGSQAGGRLTVGAWMGSNRRLGLVGRFFSLEGESVNFADSSNGGPNDPLLARPFYETWNGAPSGVGPASYVLAGQRTLGNLDFTVQGSVAARTETEVLGADAYARILLHCNRGRRLDLIAGYMFSRVDDNLQISNVSNITPATFGAKIEVEDAFEATNKFHGGQLGLLAEIDRGPLTLSLLAKMGLGNMNEVVAISGNSRITDLAGGRQSFDTGILALPSNSGVYKTDKFTIIPEAEAKLIWRLTRHLDVTLGYSCMYWNDVAMAADQIQLSSSGLPMVNSSQWFGGALQGPAAPTVSGITDTDLWLHAVNFGVTFRM